MSGPNDWAGDPGPDNSDAWWHQMDLENRRYLEELQARGLLKHLDLITQPKPTKENDDEIPRP